MKKNIYVHQGGKEYNKRLRFFGPRFDRNFNYELYSNVYLTSKVGYFDNLFKEKCSFFSIVRENMKSVKKQVTVAVSALALLITLNNNALLSDVKYEDSKNITAIETPTSHSLRRKIKKLYAFKYALENYKTEEVKVYSLIK